MIHQGNPEFLDESSVEQHFVWEIYTDDSSRALTTSMGMLFSLHQYLLSMQGETKMVKTNLILAPEVISPFNISSPPPL